MAKIDNSMSTAITSDSILVDVHDLVEAKEIARDMRKTAIVVASAYGEASEIARSVSGRYWDFVDAMAEKFAA
ncbi:hypothetical protein [Microcystis phage Mae-JY35]